MIREPYTSGEGCVLYTLSDVDRDNYVELHRQINGEKSLFLLPKTKDLMWNITLDNEKDKLYSIYEDNGEYCGCIELQNYKSNTPEIELNLVENKRNQGIAIKVVKLLVQRVCLERNIDYFLIRIMSNNLHSKHVFEKMCAVPIGKEDRPFAVFMDDLKKTMGEDNIRQIFDAIKARMDDDDENDFVCRYKLLPEAFL